MALEQILTAPTPGLVVRCWAATGDPVGPGRAAVSMTSSDDVLVVARFGPAALPLLRRGDAATALVGVRGSPADAAVVSVTELPDLSPGDGPIRVVLRIPSAPVEALWPGTRATIELAPR